MADPRYWDPQHGPGDGYFTYANMNFPIVASIVERVTGERFDHLDARACARADEARRLLQLADLQRRGRGPRGRARQCRRQAAEGRPPRPPPRLPGLVKDGEPCDLARWKLGENGGLFAPQGGLRISVRGLARVGRMLLNDGTLDGVRILSPQSVDTLFAPGLALRRQQRRTTDGGFYCSAGHAHAADSQPGARLRR